MQGLIRKTSFILLISGSSVAMAQEPLVGRFSNFPGAFAPNVDTSASNQPGGGGGGGGDRGGQPGGGGGPGMRMMFGGGGGGPGGGMDPAMTSDQLEKYATMLKLTPDQHDAAKALFDGYFTAHQERSTKMREAMDAAREEFRDSRDPAVFQEMGTKMQAFRTEGTKAEKQLFEDIKTVLTPDQADAWTQVERTHRRETGMRRGPFTVAGERADVISIIEKLDLAEEAKAPLTPVLNAYSEELDREIVKRDELRAKSEGAGNQMFRMFRPGGDAPDATAMADMEKMVKENREAMIRVRDVNRKYAKQVEAMLPAEVAPTFAKDFKKASFPDVYRDQYAARVIAAAEKMELTNEVMDSLRAIHDSYDRDSQTLNTKAEAAQEEMEASFSIAGMMGGGGGGGGGGPGGFGRNNEKMQELRTERRNIEDTTVKKVKDLLTPEQQAKLPERRDDNGPGGPGGGGGQRRNNGNGGNGNGNGDGDGQDQNQRRQRRNRPNQQPQTPPGGF